MVPISPPAPADPKARPAPPWRGGPSAFAWFLQEGRRDVRLSVVLGLQVCIIFVLAPLGATHRLSAAIYEIFRLGLAAVAVALLCRTRLAGLAILSTCLFALLLPLVLRSMTAHAALSLFRLAATFAFDLAVAVTVARVVFAPGGVNLHRIMGGVVLYLSIALLFAAAFRCLTLFVHPSFNGLAAGSRTEVADLMYFSFTTLTTTGYGDIVPVHPFVRSLANLEAVIGQLYPATLLARLVSLHGRGTRGD